MNEGGGEINRKRGGPPTAHHHHPVLRPPVLNVHFTSHKHALYIV